MLPGRFTRTILRALDRVSPESVAPLHLRTGQRGEQDAYFYLRRRGYVLIARNYRNARHKGEIDLIGWDKDVLCFIEVKARTSRDVKPGEAAVDRKKRHDLRTVIRDYLGTLPGKQFPQAPAWRFDVVTVYYDAGDKSVDTAGLAADCVRGQRSSSVHPTFELFQNASLSS